MTTRLVRLASALTVLGVAACSGSKSSSTGPSGPSGPTGSGVRVTGALSATTAAALVPLAVAPAAVGAAEQVIAIPMSHGSLGGWNMTRSETAALGAGGAFTLDLERSSDWLLVLASSTAAGSGRFLGSVNVRTGVGADLLALPFTTAAIDVLSLGTVTHTAAWDARSATTVDATAFRLSDAQLLAVARSDDVFRNALNIVNNYGTYAGAGVYWDLRPDFGWWDTTSVLSAGFSDPARLAAGYRGMSFQLGSNQTEFGIDALCAHTTVVTFEPPSAVTIDGVGYSPASPLTSAGVACDALVTNQGTSRRGWSGRLYMSGGYGASPALSVGAASENPAGAWTLRVNGAVRGRFDVAGVNPPVTAAGAPTGFVPSFRVNTQPDGRITSVDVRWFYFDGAAYVPLAAADLGVLRYFIAALELDFASEVNGTVVTEDVYLDPAVATSAAPSRYTWYYGGTPPTPQQAAGLMGFYETGGFGHFFHFPPR
jgi:hypothetical protein